MYGTRHTYTYTGHTGRTDKGDAIVLSPIKNGGGIITIEKLKEWALKWLINFNPTKTEVVLFSYTFHDYDLRLTYDDPVLNVVEIHKHLSIYLSANNKWTKHIDSIIMSASKQVSCLRKLKNKLSKNTLNRLFCTYIRSLLEYGPEVWECCSVDDTNR